MITRTFSVAFDGAEARTVEVQCSLSAGMPAFSIVGLPDKAVSESRERVRAALTAMAVALPMKRITVNLSPADLPKNGSHFDLPIALCLLAAIGIVPPEKIEALTSLGELSLDGRLVRVVGALPAAVAAATEGHDLACPAACGAEAAWVGAAHVYAADSLAALVQHLSGQRPLAPARAGLAPPPETKTDLRDIRGQARAKRALEIAAAGGHHLLMVGPPGSGKSMLAARLAGLLPESTAQEALETSMIHSLAGLLGAGGITRTRPFRQPHHTATSAAMTGGGRNANPGEISLAHNGVLFLDELPEFGRSVLDSLRQPLETGTVAVARANAHVHYPCRFQLIAAANPCRCGSTQACRRGNDCRNDYFGKISGPLLDRFDLRLEVPAVDWQDLQGAPTGETTATVAARVAAARTIQTTRYDGVSGIRTNADVNPPVLEEIAPLDAAGQEILAKAAQRMGLTGRGYHRLLRVARTIADLAGAENIAPPHLAEAISFRLPLGHG